MRKRQLFIPKQPVPVAVKVAGSVVLALFMGIGVTLLALFGSEIWKTLDHLRWPEVPCAIESSEVVNTASNSGGSYRVRITYEYERAGKLYRSDTIGGTDRFSDYGKAGELAAKYPKGAETICYVNPDAPGQSLLQRSWSVFWITPFLLIPLIFAAVGAAGLYKIWFGSRRTKTFSEEASAPITLKRRSRASGAFLVVLFGFFAIGGIVGFGFMWIQPLWRIWNARQWVKVPCVIESSKLQVNRGSESTTYRIDILYRYQFGKLTHRSNRYSFVSWSSSGYASKQAIVQKYRAGSEAVCYVDPSNPSQSVLNRGFTQDLWFGLLPLAFFGVGATGLIYNLRRRTPAAASVRSQVHTLNPRHGQGVPGALVSLKPASSPVQRAVLLFLVALFWNAVVSMFVFSAIAAWRSGNREWILTLFVVPFVLIGLLILGTAFKAALTCLNPRPELTATDRAVPLGSTLEVHYRFHGNVRRITRARVCLEGIEEARYRRGKSTSTDKNTFYSAELLDTGDRFAIAHGSFRVPIPARTMHTFTAPNNKIRWCLRVQGVVDRWPDVDEEFPIEVLPNPPAPA